MSKASQLIFIHGLEGSSRGVKATLLRGLFPGILTPDFRGSLAERMQQLEAILQAQTASWTLVGSSFGGLMAAMYTCHHPGRVRKQVLLAPALVWPDFARQRPEPVPVPTVVYHGSRDQIVPLAPVRNLAEQVFTTLDFRVVDDDHGLYQTVHDIDWTELLEVGPGGAS